MRVRASATPRRADARAVGVTSDAVTDPYLVARGFAGKAAEVCAVPDLDGGGVVLYVGVGPAADVTTAVLRRAAGMAARAAGKARSLVLDLAGAATDGIDPAAAARAVAEGAVLGAYRYDAWRTSPPNGALADVTVVTDAPKAAVARGVRAAEATCLARDLVNEPGGSLTAPALAERAEAVAEASGLRCTVHDLEALRRLGFGGLLAVNQGSTQPPRFVELGYEPTKAGKGTPTIALVGKGITFDSGGLSIKTAEGMASMKSDMGGAAAIIAALSAAADLRVAVRVRAYLPMTDNMLGGDAVRVGDVVRHYGGSTTEVLNTDAEGRLLLADALAYASESRRGHRAPDAVVDVATLTGACIVALGTRTAGLMGNDDELCGRILAAGARAGEPLWRLPLPEVEKRRLESKVADRKNTGHRYGGALHAGLFLRDFVADGVPWAHLDIAGPAFNEDVDDAEIPAGGTGFATRTLLELLTAF
jgi:leucyl aminopeptidase